MNRETEPIMRTPNPPQEASMDVLLAQLQSTRSIYFCKALPKTAIYNPNDDQAAKLSLPKQFVEDHGTQVWDLVTLRVRTPSGRSSRSWRVHCCVHAATLKVAIVGGWAHFAFDNRLQKGDFVVFVLREDARSEFEVHVFRGPSAIQYFPDQGERSDEGEEEQEDGASDSEQEEETETPSSLASPEHQQDRHNQAFRREIREESPAPFQQTGDPRVPPRFSKVLKASNIRGSSGELNAGQFEFPNRFIRKHGQHVHGSVKLQGIHENSRNYVVYCRRSPRNLFKVYLVPTAWSRFVQDNDLKEGQELQFSLMADSYFLVRRIS